MKDNVTVTND